MLVGVSKVPRAQDDDIHVPIELSDVVDKLTESSGLPEELAALVRTLGERTFVSHPTDDGNETWETQWRLTERIRALKPITDPSSIFKTVLIADDELALRNIVEEMQRRVNDLLNKNAYDSAEQTLRDLFGIKAVDNQDVTRRLSDVSNDLWKRALAFLIAAMEATMLERFEDAERNQSELSIFSEKLAWALPGHVDLARSVGHLRSYLDQQTRSYNEQKQYQEEIERLQSDPATDEFGIFTADGARIQSTLAAWSSCATVSAPTITPRQAQSQSADGICGKVVVSRPGQCSIFEEAKSHQANGAVGLVVVGIDNTNAARQDEGEHVLIPVMIVSETWGEQLPSQETGAQILLTGTHD